LILLFFFYLRVQDSDSDSGSDDDDDSNDDDSDVNWESDSESSSSSDDDEGLGELKGRARWLKKTTVVTKKEKKKQEHKPKEDGAAKKVSTVTSRDHEAIRAPKSVIPEEGLTAAILQRKVKEIVALRGRRGTDNRVILRQLEGLSRLSMQFGPRVEVPVLMYVISAQFGMQRTMDDYMEPSAWRSCASYLQRISEYIVDQDYRLGVETIDEADMILGKANKMKAAATGSGEGAMAAVAAEQKLVNPHTGEVETEDQRAERIRLENESKMTAEELKTIPVVGSLTLHMSMLEEEYTKSLQHISQHSEEYIARLRDESKLVHLLSKIQSYLEREGANEDAAKLAQLRVEHIYYRHDSIATMVEKASEFFEKYGEVSMLHPACVSNQPGGTDFTVSHPAAVSGTPSIPDSESAVANADWTEVMNKLCTFVYKHGSEQAKARATICQVYHHALHDRFLEARDLLLMSHIQENIYNIGDVTTMILFNRMMAILGMCAFRLGRLHEAHNCLGEVCSGRVRELLAQGVSMGRFSDKTPEQEKAEKRRQVPYHQHINLDLLEACHLISAMLLEIPNMAAASVGGDAFSGRRSRTISRTFRKYFDMYDHQVFTGPPEQTRDFVMKASKALALGDWKTCASMVTGLEVWNLVPGDNAIEQIKTMLTEKIKLEGLRTYLFAFSAQYDSLSLSQLCGMFEMSKNEVHSVVSKMMINRELFASWDQVTSTIVLRKVEPNSLQVMALQFAEKAANLVEANERLLDSQTGNGFRDDWHHKGGGDNDYNRNRGGRDGGHRGQGGRGGGRGGRGRGQGRGGGRGGRGRGQGGRGGRGRGQGTNNRPRR
jgi:translation initiation factor 3 subunit C